MFLLIKLNIFVLVQINNYLFLLNYLYLKKIYFNILTAKNLRITLEKTEYHGNNMQRFSCRRVAVEQDRDTPRTIRCRCTHRLHRTPTRRRGDLWELRPEPRTPFININILSLTYSKCSSRHCSGHNEHRLASDERTVLISRRKFQLSIRGSLPTDGYGHLKRENDADM